MAGTKPESEPRFVWRGLLIILPVVVLAGMGFRFLRQDRLWVERDATERAQAIADALQGTLWRALVFPIEPASRSNLYFFEVDETGALIDPKPVAPAPDPSPFDLAALTPSQRADWERLREQGGSNKAAALEERCARFLATRPPSNFIAAAEYQLGLAWAAEQDLARASNAFARLLESPALTEGGLPYRQLAQIKLLELGGGSRPRAPLSFQAVCSNLVHDPSPLTPWLLERALEKADTPEDQNTAREWLRAWRNRETAVRLHTQARSILAQAAPPRAFWIQDPPSQPWLALRLDGPGRRYVCGMEAGFGPAIHRAIAEWPLVPPYLGIGVDLGGEPLHWLDDNRRLWREVDYMGRGAGGLRPEVSTELSTNRLASSVRDENGRETLRVSVYLTNPGQLLKRQRARASWFGLLIAGSALAALTGLAAAWHGFRRQQQLSEMKSNFVSSVSHELRAPIASVRLMAENLDRGRIPDPARQQEYFRLITQECRRLSSLIENVLDFARIEQGRQRYEFDLTDLAELARQTARLMEPAAAARGVRLECAPGAGEDPSLQADGKALQQALVNLIDNAIKHSPHGAVVRIGWENGPPAALWVEDQGPGIPPAEQEKIFERFYRRGSELRRETAGIGIGLSIVKHIVQAHGGRVRVRSAPGCGSRFTLELPPQIPSPTLS